MSMTYTDVKNPSYKNSDSTIIDCEVKFDGFDDYLQFTATATDTTDYGVDIFNACVAGTYGTVAAYVATKTNAEAVATAKKAALLQSINNTTQLWQTQLALGIITDADKTTLTAWMKYAQEVQAIDTTATSITWPEEPTTLTTTTTEASSDTATSTDTTTTTTTETA
ncbi:tail fiber assembly protein (plasmid) [Rouxiella badensis]|uniref:Phage tail protein n=1 Tax=Rouxiella badensis TaxID=1646377 RepID=A0A1X0WB10_9GAMM|nr:tail fiber assembly protein [Rouxiella badensis]ORJ23970.1 hypothetical protein BS640_18895 [Rouxiella badensis]WAT03222.1 tail fiber assembly protein [Rouxiella badensis]WAT03227.1 tail fiber assembly protein [Rouxiella badensis]WAT03253.1 tail fiber assembly protein [Rouxiella badensis]WAT03257.1 tail fiber assembly protein [Rouxiella badensis]